MIDSNLLSINFNLNSSPIHKFWSILKKIEKPSIQSQNNKPKNNGEYYANTENNSNYYLKTKILRSRKIFQTLKIKI